METKNSSFIGKLVTTLLIIYVTLCFLFVAKEVFAQNELTHTVQITKEVLEESNEIT
jgi:hypothetical protein